MATSSKRQRRLWDAYATNARNHMRGALRQGASPREVLEVIFQTCANFGMPPMLRALEVFVELMAEDKRLAEIGNRGGGWRISGGDDLAYMRRYELSRAPSIQN